MSFTNLKKKWKAIKSTRVTTIFASLAVIQFLVLESLQLKILVQHISLAEYVVPNLQLSRANSTCYLNDMLTPLSLPYSENAIFLIFHAFQLSFIIDSIIYRNTICILVATILNFMIGIFAIFQAQDSNALITGLQQTCTKLDPTYLYSSFTGIEVPHLAMAFVFTAFVAALTYFFYKMFGLIEYATNLSEDALNSAYRTRMIFKALLKVNLLFIFSYCFLSLGAIFPLIRNSATVTKYLFLTHFLMLIFSFIFASIAFFALVEELKSGMLSFMIFWGLLVIDLFYLLVAHGSSAAAIGWIFWILFTVIFLIVTIATFIFAILAFKNFGKGLKKYVNHLSLQEYESSLFLQKAKVIDSENHHDMRTWRSEE
ncbi:hypothetical protein F8M41_009340 [Gigaspora margarita]|uniref:Uncharacterized protein n=1 Tax=Gigaspora margarita TaxID=4874 RepID=A0A8H4AV99_GIGMA|nr:hypothetical protein F8M41_009340 [Gigaspora margarita]